MRNNQIIAGLAPRFNVTFTTAFLVMSAITVGLATAIKSGTLQFLIDIFSFLAGNDYLNQILLGGLVIAIGIGLFIFTRDEDFLSGATLSVIIYLALDYVFFQNSFQAISLLA